MLFANAGVSGPKDCQATSAKGTKPTIKEFQEAMWQPDMENYTKPATGFRLETIVGLSIQSQANSRVGTQEVAVYLCNYRSDINIYLIDSPSCNDTSRSDTNVLKEIASWSIASCSHAIKPHGILYLHCITKNRSAV